MTRRDSATAILLDANLLVALADAAHVHHAAAASWFVSGDFTFATCPFTQVALLRVLLRLGTVPDATIAAEVLRGFTRHARHRFWRDELDCSVMSWSWLVGHRQVTDGYLAALARHHGGKLATLDRGLAAVHADVAVLVTP